MIRRPYYISMAVDEVRISQLPPIFMECLSVMNFLSLSSTSSFLMMSGTDS